MKLLTKTERVYNAYDSCIRYRRMRCDIPFACGFVGLISHRISNIIE